MKSSSDADERTLQEIYLPPFAAAVQAGTAAVMCAYNRVRGTYACRNNHTLNTVLKGQLGFKGFVMSDWWAVHSTEAAEGGVDQNQPGTDGYFSEPALRPELVKNMAFRVLRGMLSCGAFDSFSCMVGCDCEPLMMEANATSSEHVALARRIAAESAVLLLNRDLPSTSKIVSPTRKRALPLQPHDAVALLGSVCDSRHSIDVEKDDWTASDYYVMGGSGRVVSDRAVSIRQGLEARNVRIQASLTDDVDDAVAAMSGADIALVCAGTSSSEFRDRPDLLLDQHSFLTAVAKKAKIPLVVAAIAPGPILVSGWAENSSAVMTMFLAGQETGNAWADVLLGDVNPSGKLPVTFPADMSEIIQPCTSDRCEYSEGLFSGWRGLISSPVAFPFGHGLSYTEFEYSWSIPPTYDHSTQQISMIARIHNQGSLGGADVVQLYVSFPKHAKEPERVLRDFAKTPILQPGEEYTVTFVLTVEKHLSIWGTQGWVPVAGNFIVAIGPSSRQLPLQHTVRID